MKKSDSSKNTVMNPPKSEAVWPTVHLRHGEAERIQAGHPWIYARNIQKVTQDPSDGSVVQVRDLSLIHI